VVGDLWRNVISELLPAASGRIAVHEGALLPSRFSRLVCFAGLGPGEVTLDGKKVVGLSQRRDRAGAWFFALAHVAFDADAHAELFPSLGPAEQRRLSEELRARVAPLEATAHEVEAALLACLG
jgi:lipoate-protein ligase A